MRSVETDFVTVDMPSSLNELLRALGDVLVHRAADGTYELRHDKETWVRSLAPLLAGADDAPDAELAFDHLRTAVSAYNAAAAVDAAATPLPI